ncbi:MAG: hypothetical protein WC356_02950 [Candidatus Micrarchaeia archaeon]|jgi:hypothetical protein
MTEQRQIRWLVIGLWISIIVSIGSMMQTASIKRENAKIKTPIYNVYTNTDDVNLAMIQLGVKEVKAGIR